MIGGIGPQTGYYTLQQASQAQAAASKLDLFSDVDDSDSASSASSTGKTQGSSASSSASGAAPNLLSSTTLASLLGLQMVNGQAQGGASGAQMNLPQVNMSSGMDPGSLLNTQTLQMLQSIGA